MKPAMPHGWRLMPIGEVCRLVNGRAFKPSEWGQDGLPIIRIQNLNDRTKPFNRFNGTVSPKHLVQPGDVLLSWSGTPGTSFGCFVWDREPGVLNQHIFKVEVRTEFCAPDYFVHAVNSVLDVMIREAHGGVGLRHITKSRLQRICLPVAPLSEQRRIVARIQECLARVEEMRNLAKALRLEAGVIEMSAFRDAVETLPEKQRPVVSLGSVIVDSQYGTSTRAGSSGKGYPVLRMGNIQNGQLNLTDMKFVPLSCDEARKYLLRDGDLLINRTNSLELVGKAAVFDAAVGDNYVFASYLIRLRLDASLALPGYIAAAINSVYGRDYVLRTARRAIGMVNINAREIAAMPLPLPSIAVQERVLARLNAARRTAMGILESIDLNRIEALHESILRHAFAGEL